MKRVVSFLLCIAMVMSLAACGGKKDAVEAESSTEANNAEIVTGMIAYSFGTQSFSDDVLAGLVKAEEELEIPHYELEIADVTETANGFRTLIQQGVNFVVATTAEYCDGMLEVAAEYPDVYFLYWENICRMHLIMLFHLNIVKMKPAFLAGALGGLLTESNKNRCSFGGNRSHSASVSVWLSCRSKECKSGLRCYDYFYKQLCRYQYWL